MRIKEVQSALLPNHEVLLTIQREQAEYDGTDGTGRARPIPAGLKTMLRDTNVYLTNQESSIPGLLETHPSRPKTLYQGPNSLFQALAPKYRINKTEFLQIYNLRPRNLVTLELIIEESSARFSEDQLNDILATVQQVFDEDEGDIPVGAEDKVMPKVANKLEGAGKKRKGKKKKAATNGA